MTTLRKQIDRRVKGALQEREDWWYLCYDTETKEFYVEHDWHHMNAYKASEKANEGKQRTTIEDHDGPGSSKIDQARADLLKEAGNA